MASAPKGKAKTAAPWVCPECKRSFRRAGQSHECAPAMTIEDYFATGPSFERPIFEAVRDFVAELGDVTIEPVQVGIFFKRPSSWIQLRPKRSWVSLTFPLRRNTVSHRTIKNKPMSNGRESSVMWFAANLERPEDFDDDLQTLLAESWDSFGNS